MVLPCMFKVKVEVFAQNNTAVFVLFDRDMSMLIKKTCEGLLIQKHEDVTGDGYPSVFDSLIGQRILFKVEIQVAQSRQFEGNYPVRRVCVDKDVIGMFDLAGADLTPTKMLSLLRKSSVLLQRESWMLTLLLAKWVQGKPR